MKIFAWFAGVDPERLAAHRSTSRYLVVAFGMVLGLVTGPIVALAMGSYAYGSLPPSFGDAPRLLTAIGIGSAWMMAIWTIDRALIISSDAVSADRRVLLAAGFALRMGLAGILASIFAGQLVQLLYSKMLDTTAQHLALDLREHDAERLAQLHGVPAVRKEVAALEAKAAELVEQQKTIPVWILDKFTGADQCEKQARQLAIRVNRDPTPGGWQAVAKKNAACRKLRADAVHDRDEYLQEVQVRITENAELLHAAHGRADTAIGNMIADRQKVDAGTEAGYSSISAREIAFEQLQTDHPEIRTTARLWWGALLILELLPVLLKMMSRNNPVAAEAQADLAEGAAQHRIRVKRLQGLEISTARVLARGDVQQSVDAVTAEYTVAMSHLTSFGQLVARIVQEHQRQRDVGRAHPDLAFHLDAAFAEAVASALGSSPRQGPFSMAAE